MVHRIFPYTLMRVGQVRPCQTRQRFYYSLQLAWHIPSAIYPRLTIQVITFGCWLTNKVLSSALGWDRHSYSVVTCAMFMLVRLTTLLGSSPLPNMDEFTSAVKLLLSMSTSSHVGAMWVPCVLLYWVRPPGVCPLCWVHPYWGSPNWGSLRLDPFTHENVFVSLVMSSAL